jgi:short-subunit dehydrogenase
MKIDGANILLTGAAGGIGEAIAARLAASGARLILVGRSAPRLEALIARLPASKPAHRVVEADLASPDGRRLIGMTLAVLGAPLDALINCAGVSRFGLLAQQTEQEIQSLFATNLLAPVLLTKMALPFLRQNTGRIVNVGSTFGGIGYPGFSTYCASKFALRGFTQSLRRELADSEIQVAYLAPRATRTALNSDAVCAMNNELGNTMDPPQRVADVLFAMLQAKRMGDRAIGWPERLFLRINALLPAVVDGALRKQLPIIKRHALPGSGQRVATPSTAH